MADNVGSVAAIYEAFGTVMYRRSWTDSATISSGKRHSSDGDPVLLSGRGKAHVVQFFEHLAANLELTRFEPMAICDGGEIVTVPIMYAGRIIGGGEIAPTMECHVALRRRRQGRLLQSRARSGDPGAGLRRAPADAT